MYRTGDDVLEGPASIREWAQSEIPAAPADAVERHEHGRRGLGVRVRFGEKVEPGNELLVEAAHLPVEDEGRSQQRGDRLGKLGEAGCVIAPRAAHEADASILLKRDDAPAVVLFVHPAVAVGLACSGWIRPTD